MMGNNKDNLTNQNKHQEQSSAQNNSFTPLPQWHVMLRHVQRHEIPLAIQAIKQIVHLDNEQATAAAFEANIHGVGFITSTHYELAEHYMECFTQFHLMATLEPMDVFE